MAVHAARLPRWSLPLLVACILALGSLGVHAQSNWEQRSAVWRERQTALIEEGSSAAGSKERSNMDLDSLVDASFVRARIGVIDVHLPVAALEDLTWRTPLIASLAALAEMQARWNEWSSESGDEAARAEYKGLIRLGRALRKFKASKLRRLDVTPGMDLLRALELDEALLESIDAIPPTSARPSNQQGSLNESGLTQDASGGSRLPIRLILLPERGPFLDYVAAAGQALPYLRDVFWNEQTRTWLAIDHDQTRVAALSFFDPGNPRGPGIPMNKRNPKALEEHVCQVAIRGLIERELGSAIEPMLAAGIATELIIDQFGEADTYTDGDTSARQTNARSVFIPGGNPNGGTLPQMQADSRWRADRGRGFFVSILKRAQRAGAKEAGRKASKLTNFLLESESGANEVVVQAPFLGPRGQVEPPGAAFQDDYQGLLRAYRTAFLHWLRTAAVNGKTASEKRFQVFLDRLASAPSDTDASVLIEAVYGLPMSDGTLKDGASLEGSFLRWLSKQR